MTQKKGGRKTRQPPFQKEGGSRPPKKIGAICHNPRPQTPLIYALVDHNNLQREKNRSKY